MTHMHTNTKYKHTNTNESMQPGSPNVMHRGLHLGKSGLVFNINSRNSYNRCPYKNTSASGITELLHKTFTAFVQG